MKRIACFISFLIFSLFLREPVFSQINPVNQNNSNHFIDSATLKELLIKPPCLAEFHPDEKNQSYQVEEIQIPSNGIMLSGWLYLPKTSGQCTLVIFMHGGTNDPDLAKAAPLFYAPRLAHCGIAALIYDKRGTGKSSGDYGNSTYDDFISDAGNAAIFLSKRPDIDPNRIGVYGGSEGGLLAPLVAARFPIISFAISVSGPIMSLANHANFNIQSALRLRGTADSTIEQVLPTWRRSSAAREKNDPIALRSVDQEIIEMRKRFEPSLLPSTQEEVATDSGLISFKPLINSMSRNYVAELKQFRKKWLALYGEQDIAVDVKASVKNIQEYMSTSGNQDYTIVIVPEVDHSYINTKTGRQLLVENIYINWLYRNLNMTQ